MVPQEGQDKTILGDSRNSTSAQGRGPRIRGAIVAAQHRGGSVAGTLTPVADQTDTPPEQTQKFDTVAVGLGPTLAGSMLLSTLSVPFVLLLPETRRA
jgi:hypothetical protein